MFENPARTRIGKITQPSEIVCYMSSKKGVDVAAQVEIGADLTNDQRAAVEDVINKYADVFAANPKKPNRVKVTHHVDTGSEQPIAYKNRRIPNAWQAEVDEQVTEMLKNDIIRPSCSAWNAPILLVKKG